MSRYTYLAAVSIAALSSVAFAQSGNSGNNGSGQCNGCTGVDTVSQSIVSAGGNPNISGGYTAGLEYGFGNGNGAGFNDGDINNQKNVNGEMKDKKDKK